MDNRQELLRKHLYEKVLDPMKELIPRIIQGLREFNVHFPIQKIAYMEIRGYLAVDELLGFRDELLQYLEKGYRFKKYYWKFIQRSYRLFDDEMKKEGAFAPGYKYYQTLRVDMYLALFGLEGDVWCGRFDSYIAQIKNRCGGPAEDGRTGKILLADIAKRMGTPMTAIEKRQKMLIRESLRMKKRVNGLIEDPSELLGDTKKSSKGGGGRGEPEDEADGEEAAHGESANGETHEDAGTGVDDSNDGKVDGVKDNQADS